MPSISTLPSKDAYGGSAKASPLRGTAGGRKIQGPTTPSLQGCLQARPANSLKSIPTPGRSGPCARLRRLASWCDGGGSQGQGDNQAGREKERQASVREATNYICTKCNKDCHSRIGLLSHSRACRHWCADHGLPKARMPSDKQIVEFTWLNKQITTTRQENLQLKYLKWKQHSWILTFVKAQFSMCVSSIGNSSGR